MKKIVFSSFVITFMLFVFTLVPVSARSLTAGDYYGDSARYNGDMYVIDFDAIRDRISEIDFSDVIDVSSYDGVFDYEYIDPEVTNNFREIYDDVKMNYNDSEIGASINEVLDRIVDFFSIENFPTFS